MSAHLSLANSVLSPAVFDAVPSAIDAFAAGIKALVKAHVEDVHFL